MIWLLGILIVLAIGAVFVVAAGWGEPLVAAYDDRPDPRFPGSTSPGARGPLTGAEIRQVRFTTAVRGYRASEVDALLSQVAAELDARPARPVDASAPPEPGSSAPGAG